MPTADAYILAIDLGTSGPKVALVSTRGRVVASEIEATALELSPDGRAEQDPDEWWKAITAASRRVLKRSLVPVSDVVAVNVAAQWSGTVAVDRRGRHLMPAVIWLDSRGAPYVRALTRGLVQVQGYGVRKLVPWLRKTGGIPAHSGKDPVGHILYIRHQRPEVYDATYKFLEPKDYLNWRMTGRFVASYDSITLHWVTDNRDIAHIDYDEELLALSTLDRDKLPDLVPTNAVLGPLLPEAAAALGLPADVQVVGGTPDVLSAAVGSGAVRDYEAHLYIGTSSWVTCHLPFKKTDVLRNIASLPSALPGRYFAANEQETAGACLALVRDSWLYPDDALATGPRPDDAWDRINRVAADVAPGSDRVIFTPWLYGERTPVDDHHLRAGFFNLSLATTRPHLVRAVMEGVAYNTRWLYGHVENFLKRRLEAVNIIGGGALSDVWCQIFADVLDRRVRQVEDPVQANARGAALLAAMALGDLAVEDLADCVKVVRTFEPQPAHRGTYDRLFREFLNIYKNNRRMYARLNRSLPT